MRFFQSFVQRVNWLLVLIMALGLGLRLWGINFGLPYMYDADEGVPVGIALRILRTGNLNPEFFDWPSLSIYLNTLVYVGYFAVGRVLGWFATPGDLPFPNVEIMAVGKTALPGEFLLGRGLTAVFGVLSILVVYLICRQLAQDRLAAGLGALLLAVDSVSIRNSQIIRPDTFAVFFALLSFLFALKIINDPRLANYVFAAIGLGLAASSKYNMGLVVLPLFTAHVIQFRSRFLFRKEIYIAAVVAALAFFMTTPFALLDVAQFLKTGPAQDALHYSTGHPGAEGNSLQWYMAFLWMTQGLTLLLALGEAVSIIVNREKRGLVLLSFPLVYFVFINLYPVHFETTILPVFPFIIVLAALFCRRAIDGGRRYLKFNRAFSYAAFLVLAILLALPPLRVSAANNKNLLQLDGRESARQWIDANLPQGSRVALESYSPYVDQNKFLVSGFYGLQDNSPDWYVSNGYEYLVFSQGTFGRYFADPSRYAAQIDRYNSFFSRFDQVARFDNNNFEVRVYKTGVTLPAHRVAARYGNAGELIELVGYDDSTARWLPGQPLQVKLTWRPIEQKGEPLAVEFRLLDQNDREISRVRSDLYQGKGEPQGLFTNEWTIPTPPNITPGEYRLQVNVIQTRFEYHLPAKNWTGDDLGAVLLGSFELNGP